MDNKRLILSIFVIFLIFLSGCATSGPLLRPSFNSRQEYVRNHPRLSPEIKQAILEGRVIKGMTKEDVRASWGEPTRIKDFTTDPNAWWYDKNSEGWWYQASPLSLEPTRFIEFKKGIVVDVTEQYK
jgi:outer membrane protein assembly factor BamE (lipoprotein component of BamABCDE complex)